MASPAPLKGVAATALGVAAIRAKETAHPDRLFADPLAAAFIVASGWSPSRSAHDRRAVLLRACMVARTVFLDDLLASACREGHRQVVLLGAGLDVRAFRLPWPPGVRCFELDTADVLDHKDLVLTEQAAVVGCERIPVRCDLRTDWPGALLAAGFESGQPAVWVVEGVLTYLPQEQGCPTACRSWDTGCGLQAPSIACRPKTYPVSVCRRCCPGCCSRSPRPTGAAADGGSGRRGQRPTGISGRRGAAADGVSRWS